MRWLYPVQLALIGWVVFHLWHGMPFLALISGSFFAIYLKSLWYWRRDSRAAQPIAALVRDATWRHVGVTVLGGVAHLSTLAVLVDGETVVLRVPSLHGPHRTQLRRQQQAWLVGPDAGGVAAVRIDGSHEAHPATRVPAPTGRRAIPKAEQVDPTLAWALHLRSRARRPLTPLVLAAVFATPVFTRGTDLGLPAILVVSCLFSLTLTWSNFTAWRLWPAWRLPGLVRRGGWVSAQVAVEPLPPSGQPRGGLTARLTLPGGATAVAVMPFVLFDVVGTFTELGWLSVAGEVRPGRWVALGYPGYPVLAIAKITSVDGTP
ncbi:hypothetical protein CLV68_4813 [Actinokineospora cianjurensis]|uniref:Uncharacterized protein n=2 Tax=Actinokineospora cianjurensis TaxID=585224 RepID=A0A421AZS6_9PSEU|nr:hypothetical protein CLV68_4813 [Actinokineospora cianjurensis]